MAGKMKKNLSRRAQERLNRQLRAFDLAMLGVVLTTLAAGAVCILGTTALDRPGTGGFAYWYIVVLSYPPMLLLNFFKLLFGGSALPQGSCGAGVLTAVTLGCDLLLWMVIRILGKRNNKSELLNVCTKFALILLCWGCFQLLCAAVFAGLDHGRTAAEQRGPAETRPQVRSDDGKNAKTPAPAPLQH